MARTVIVKVLLEPEIRAALDRATAENGLTASSLLRMLLMTWLREHGYLS